MSDYTVIGDICKTLKDLLLADEWQGIGEKPSATFKSPKDIKEENTVSLFLYQVAENAHLQNREGMRIDESTLSMPPMYVDLYFLVTAYGKDEIQEMLILGKVMQIFHDNRVLTGSILQEGLVGSDEEIKLIHNTVSLDDLTKIWTAFQDVGYRLSIGYLVTPVKIESTRTLSQQRVVVKETTYKQY